MNMKRYCVVYLSPGGMHYRYRCTAKNKTEARRFCKEDLGVSDKDIVEIYMEDEDIEE